MLFLNCIELENSSLGQTIDKIDYFIDTIIFSTFRLYTYIKNPPKGAFTHKTENLPKTSFYKAKSSKDLGKYFHWTNRLEKVATLINILQGDLT